MVDYTWKVPPISAILYFLRQMEGLVAGLSTKRKQTGTITTDLKIARTPRNPARKRITSTQDGFLIIL
jgi:hypothetical protein